MPPGPLSQTVHPPAENSGLFPDTMWSMIQAAKEETEALTGLERLAQAYWRPLYVFARQRGASHDVASDEVQGFFEHLLSRDMLKNVQRGEVRFRSFLLRCFTNWLINEHHRNGAAKRGGGAAFLSIDEMDSQVDEPALIEGKSPDTAYDHGWARALVRRNFATSRAGPDWEEMALRHGMTHGAVRKAATDQRRRFGVLLRTEVRNIVSKDEEVDDELRYLISLLSIAA